MAPFQRQLAPRLVNQRHRRRLRDFQWRIAARDDARAFAAALAGRGRWQSVTVPHFGPPAGRALAFYRTTFSVAPDTQSVHRHWLRFEGADYFARIYVNGRCVATHEGFFATFECDVSAALRTGRNTLLIELHNDGTWQSVDGVAEGDKLYGATGPGWDEAGAGWHHCPAGMGLLGPVTLESRPSLFLRDVWVRPLPDLASAEIRFEVHNSDPAAQACRLDVAVHGQNFRASPVRWRALRGLQPAAAETNSYTCTVALPKGRPWSPATPWLYQVHVRLRDAEDRVIDTFRRTFGLRTFVISETTEPKGRIFLNGAPLRLRGANTMGFEQQAAMAGRRARLRDDMLLARLTHFNFLRLTQRPVQSEVYELADQLGVMLQTDLPLFGYLRRTQVCEAVRQSAEMARHVRAHPSAVVLTLINEPFPADWRAVGHRHLNRAELEAFLSTASSTIRLEHPDAQIKPVEGDYDPPAEGLPDCHIYSLWYQGHGLPFGRLYKGTFPAIKPGWCYSCGEYGAEGLDPVDLMRRRYPRSWLPTDPRTESHWTPDRISHAQSGRHQPLFFDRPATLKAWVAASQHWQAEAVRLQTEAFRRMDGLVSCAVHHFIDAWPAGWMKSIVDCERRPKAAWFACRDALAPWLPMWRCDRTAVFSGESVETEAWLANDTGETPSGWSLHYALATSEGTLASGRAKAQPRPCSPAYQGILRWVAPTVSQRTELLLHLGVFNAAGRIVNDTTIRFTVWPTASAERPVLALESKGGPAETLARELKARLDPESPVILTDRFLGNAAARARLWQRVRDGATLVFTELPPDNYRIAGHSVVITPCGFAPADFVSRDTGHPLVTDFAPNDFRFWHDSQTAMIAPLLPATFQAPGWTPILLSGQAGWGVTPRPALAAAEVRHGSGRIILSLVTLAGRTCSNPVADLYARRLLGATRTP